MFILCGVRWADFYCPGFEVCSRCMRIILWCWHWIAAERKLSPCPQKSTSFSMKNAVNVCFCCYFHLNRQTLNALQLAQANSFKLSTSQQQLEVANIFIHSLARIHKENLSGKLGATELWLRGGWWLAQRGQVWKQTNKQKLFSLKLIAAWTRTIIMLGDSDCELLT